MEEERKTMLMKLTQWVLSGELWIDCYGILSNVGRIFGGEQITQMYGRTIAGNLEVTWQSRGHLAI